MARINTNVASMIAQSNLARASGDLNTRLKRLATGLRINSGADDPAGLIISERLRSEMKGINQAIKNSERASSVIATTEGALAEVSDLLNSIKALIVQSANTGGLSKEEIEANQLQIDSAIDSITRISNTSSFAGLQLLNGSLDYNLSGVPTSAVASARVFGATFGTNTSVAVSVEVVSSAQVAQLFLSGNMAGSPGALMSSVTLEIAGQDGVTSLSFVSGTALSAVVAAVNTLKDTTGVSASLVDGANQTSGMFFSSVEYGSEEFVSVKKIGQGGDFFYVSESQNGPIKQRDIGRDVTAIVNGAVGRGDGLGISLNSPSLSIDLLLTEDFATMTGQTKNFSITGGGSLYQLGPSVTTNQQVNFGVQSVAASSLGGTQISGARLFLDSIKSGGLNSIVGGEMGNAAKILDSAITEVSVMRGRLGAFERNTIQTNIRSLQIAVENITTSESTIRDTDFAAETAELTRAQILVQAGTSVLATANSTSQNVLALLQ